MELPHTEDFITHGVYLRGWTERTVRTYRQGLAAFGSTVDALSKASLQQFVIAMQERGLQPGGINMYARTVNGYLSWLHEEGHHPEHLRVRLLRSHPKPVRALSDQDVQRLLRFKPKGRIQTRSWTIVMVLLDCGLRICEILGLERKNVDLENLVLRIDGKGNKQRLVPLSIEGRKHLFKWLRGGSGKYGFCASSGGKLTHRNTYRDIQILCRRAGVTTHVHPHCDPSIGVQHGADIRTTKDIFESNGIDRRDFKSQWSGGLLRDCNITECAENADDQRSSHFNSP